MSQQTRSLNRRSATTQLAGHLTVTAVNGSKDATAPIHAGPGPVQEPTRASRNAKIKALQNQVWLQGRKRGGSSAVEPAGNSKKSKPTADSDRRKETSAQESERQKRARFRASAISGVDSDDNAPTPSAGGERQAVQRAPNLTRKQCAPEPEAGSTDDGESTSLDEDAAYNSGELEESEDDNERLEHLKPRHLEAELGKEAASWAHDGSDNTSTRPRKPVKVLSQKLPSAEELFDDNDHVLETTPPRRSKKSKSIAKQSKRQLAHEAEAPQWTAELPATPVRKSYGRSGLKSTSGILVSPSSLRFTGDNEENNNEEELSDNDDQGTPVPALIPQRPAPTDLIFNERGRVNLSDQSEDVKAMTREAIKGVAKYLAFVDAFPEIGGRTVLSQECLVTAARDNQRYQAIFKRLVHEEGYARALSKIPDGRISTSRRNAYYIGCNHVVGGYGLTPGATCETLVAKLLKSQKYIFSGDSIDRLRKNEPYKHPAILAILSALYFAGSGALGMKHPDMFKSTSLTDSAPEIPISMVALVATTIHNALMEWQSGKRQAREFSALNCGDIYRSHVGILQQIKDKTPGFFHQLMADLYRDARAAAAAEIRVDSEDSAFTIMDLSGYL